MDGGKDEQVGSGLARGIGAVGMNGGRFSEFPLPPQRPVHLVRRDVQKSLHVPFAGGVNKDLRPQDVRRDEHRRAAYAPVDVRFRRKMHDRVGLVLLHHGKDFVPAADVAPDERVVPVLAYIPQVVQIPGVRELVVIDNTDPRMRFEVVTDKIASDEPCAACHKE